jgi:hypothetical protein
VPLHWDVPSTPLLRGPTSNSSNHRWRAETCFRWDHKCWGDQYDGTGHAWSSAVHLEAAPTHQLSISSYRTSAGAPSTIQYGPVRSKSTALCRGWVETVASASPEPSWSSSVDSIATSSNRGRTRLDHRGGRPSSPVPAQVSTKLPIPNLWGLPNLYHTLPPFCVLRLCMAGMEIRGQARKPASPPTASLLRTLVHW